MRVALVCVLALGCAGDPPPDFATVPVEPGHSDTASSSGGTDATLLIAAPEAVGPAHERVLTFTSSLPVEVAAACTDGAETHLAIARADGPQELRFSGLVAETAYECVAATTDPPGPPVPFHFETGPQDAPSPRVMVTTDPNVDMSGTYTLLNVRRDAGGVVGQWLAVFDPEGRVRWWYPVPTGVNSGIEFRYQGDDLFVWGGGDSPEGAPRIVDLYAGEVYRTAIPGAESTLFNHDGKMLPDGRILTLEAVQSVVVQGLTAFRIRLHHPDTGRVDYVYDSDAAVYLGDLPQGKGDWYHANWADVGTAADGTSSLVVSLCRAQEVIAIDPVAPPSGPPLVQWEFGRGGDFALRDAKGVPLPDSEFPQCQHGLEYDQGRLLVYDNGTTRGYTRASEYALDLVNHTATRTWSWTEPGWFEPALGDVDWLANDHVLVTQAHSHFSPIERPTTYVEIDRATNTPVWRMTLLDPDDTGYRSDRVDGCALFTNTRWCPALAAELEALAPILYPDPD